MGQTQTLWWAEQTQMLWMLILSRSTASKASWQSLARCCWEWCCVVCSMCGGRGENRLVGQRGAAKLVLGGTRHFELWCSGCPVSHCGDCCELALCALLRVLCARSCPLQRVPQPTGTQCCSGPSHPPCTPARPQQLPLSIGTSQLPEPVWSTQTAGQKPAEYLEKYK